MTLVVMETTTAGVLWENIFIFRATKVIFTSNQRPDSKKKGETRV